MGRPDLAVRTRGFTSPPTPAIHDISATLSLSSLTAMWLAICAALDAPEQEYTRGSFDLAFIQQSSFLLKALNGVYTIDPPDRGRVLSWEAFRTRC